MKIVFVSNNYNHHERFFCEELNKFSDVEFFFIQTQPMREERVKMGWGIDTSRFPFVYNSFESETVYKNALQLCNEADAVIIGSAPYKFIADRVKNNRLTFFYAERLFRKGLWHMLYPPTFFTVLKRFIVPGRKSNFYLLCASGYTAVDTSKIFAFNNHRFKWGHFIDVNPYPNINSFYAEKVERLKHHKGVSILWAGRLIRWKHPDMAVKIAKTLKQKNIPFTMNIIGTGEMEYELKEMISTYNLSDSVKMPGAMTPPEVRQHMLNSEIYLFTSDFNEGWGAVLGESMASGCAVVTSHGIGATPFLIQHKENGLIYETGNYGSFERNVLKLVESKEFREKLSKNTVKTMQECWNPQTGAYRFYQFVKQILENGRPMFYDAGPISEAKILKNNWFKDDTV